MHSTMNLLADAEQVKDLSAWAESLGLTKRALYTAKYRGSLSPAIAGALAEELGKDPKDWIVVAALESERDSACKERMLKRVRKMTSLYRCHLAQRPRRSYRWIWSRKHETDTPSMSARTAWVYQPLRHALTA